MCTALAHGEWFGARRDLGKMGRVQPHEKAAEIGFGEEAGQKQNKTKQKQNKTTTKSKHNSNIMPKNTKPLAQEQYCKAQKRF